MGRDGAPSSVGLLNMALSISRGIDVKEPIRVAGMPVGRGRAGLVENASCPSGEAWTLLDHGTSYS